jgi:hypothetical protein
MKSEPTPSDGEVLTGLAQHPICCYRSRVDLSVRSMSQIARSKASSPILGKSFAAHRCGNRSAPLGRPIRWRAARYLRQPFLRFEGHVVNRSLRPVQTVVSDPLRRGLGTFPVLMGKDVWRYVGWSQGRSFSIGQDSQMTKGAKNKGQ